MAKDYLDALFSIADQIEEHERSDDKLSGDILAGDILAGDILSGDKSSGDILSGEELSGERELPYFVELNNSYYKTDNEIDDLLIPYIGNASAQTVYRLLYRHSYGWGEPVCDRLTIDDMAKLSGLSGRTVSRAVDRLVEIGCIEIIGEAGRTTPRKYWVKLPCQISAIIDQSKRSPAKLSGDKSLGDKLSGDKSSGTDLTNCRVNQDKLSGDKLSGEVGKPFADAGFEPEKIAKNAPKDIIKDIIKNNNNKDDVVVDNLRLLGVKEKTARRWIAEFGLDLVKEKIHICRLYLEREPGKIQNPPGWLAKALQEDWDYPDWYYAEVADIALQKLD